MEKHVFQFTAIGKDFRYPSRNGLFATLPKRQRDLNAVPPAQPILSAYIRVRQSVVGYSKIFRSGSVSRFNDIRAEISLTRLPFKRVSDKII